MADLEETLREVCSLGDLEKAKVLLNNGVNINSQNKMNGWSALHWAAKRNHVNIVSYLLENGADPSISTFKAELPIALTQSYEIKRLLSSNSEETVDVNIPVDCQQSSIKFVPNYLSNPNFPYSETAPEFARRLGIPYDVMNGHSSSPSFEAHTNKNDNECQFKQSQQREQLQDLVLKLRIAESVEKDFIEVELDEKHLNFDSLVNLCITDLNIEREQLDKIRKLPNTIVRNDKDVRRLKQFQEIEVVLKKTGSVVH